MARHIRLTGEDHTRLCAGETIQHGPVRTDAAPDFCQSSAVTIMLDEQMLAQLLLGGTVTVGNVTLDWNETPEHTAEVASKLATQAAA